MIPRIYRGSAKAIKFDMDISLFILLNVKRLMLKLKPILSLSAQTFFSLSLFLSLFVLFRLFYHSPLPFNNKVFISSSTNV